MSAIGQLDDRASFVSRLWTYQAERFPLFRHGLLIVTFAFSAASYSRICRGENGFISAPQFLVGAFTAFILFFLLRVADEFKDASEDAQYRPYRPVPRGLISLRELGLTGVAAVAITLALNALLMPKMLLVYTVPIVFLTLMIREFFVRDWLKKNPMIYMFSHMLILPAIDFYTTGLDWLNAGVSPPKGLQFFLLLTFLNGIVIEVGRKIRAVDAEETGVETYSALYGYRKATVGWLLVLITTFASASFASFYAGEGAVGFAVLTGCLLLCAIPAIRFLRTRNQRDAHMIETAAGVWTIAMYLTLGGVPMVLRALR